MQKSGIIFTLLLVSFFSFTGCGEDDEENLNETTDFVLSSSEIDTDLLLPTEYTCDGDGSTLPLEWSGVPEGTKSFALVMHHEVSSTDIHWYWIVYNISADKSSIAKNEIDFGTLGNNSVNGLTAYSPPCSQGPGEKEYIYTLYALSDYVEFSVSPEEVSREVLLNAIEDIIIDSSELRVLYSREFD